jgi:hypothetical protein
MQLPGVIRTVVPMMVGAFVSFLAMYGIEVSTTTAQALTLGLSGLLGAVYYAVATALESRWPIAGLLLGTTVRPTYQGRHRREAAVPSTATATPGSPDYRE